MRIAMTDASLAVVAGVGPGMGLALARRFAADGGRVAMIARRREALDGYAEAIAAETRPGAAKGFPGDLSDPADVARVMGAIRAVEGPARLLIYNAGVWVEASAMALPIADFERDLSLCVTGALVAAQSAYPDMKAAGGGTLLFTGGGLALAPGYGAVAPSLTAGKSALRGLVHAMAGPLRAEGVAARMVTIAGTVAPGGPFDPDLIAGRYAALAALPADDETVEVVHDGQA